MSKISLHREKLKTLNRQLLLFDINRFLFFILLKYSTKINI